MIRSRFYKEAVEKLDMPNDISDYGGNLIKGNTNGTIKEFFDFIQVDYVPEISEDLIEWIAKNTDDKAKFLKSELSDDLVKNYDFYDHFLNAYCRWARGKLFENIDIGIKLFEIDKIDRLKDVTEDEKFLILKNLESKKYNENTNFKDIIADIKALKDRLTKLRKSTNITKEELSKYLELEPEELALLEMGVLSFNLTLIDKICTLFDCSEEYLLGYEESYIPAFDFSKMRPYTTNLADVAVLNKIARNLRFCNSLLSETSRE